MQQSIHLAPPSQHNEIMNTPTQRRQNPFENQLRRVSLFLSDRNITQMKAARNTKP